MTGYSMIDAILCGNLRSEISFYEILRELVRAKQDGVVGQIVFSTWQSEHERFPDLFREVNACGVDVVLIKPPTPYGGSLPIQHMQMWRGMQALDNQDGWLLRTRTDKAFQATIQQLRGLREGSLDLDAMPRPSDILERRLVVDGVSLTEPFAHNDLTLLSWKADLKRLLNVDAAYDYLFADNGYFPQEVRWFAAPVMARHPQFKHLFETISIYRLTAALRAAAARGALDEAPDAVARYLGAYWSIAQDLYTLIDLQDHGEPPPFQELVAGRGLRPFAVNWGDRLLATSEPYWRGFIGGSDPFLRRAAGAMVAPRDAGAAIGDLDLESLQHFIQAELGPAPEAAVPVTRLRRTSEGGADLKRVFATLAPDVARDAATLDDCWTRVEAAVERDRSEFANHYALLAVGRELDAEARDQGDAAKANTAFILLLGAAWARIPDAVDLLCGIAADGLVDARYLKAAFEPVYASFVHHPNDPRMAFWYGLDHIGGYSGGVHNEFGLKQIRLAADQGVPRAQAFLAALEPDPAAVEA